MYKTILVPLDGSKRAEAILPHVKGLAKLDGARIVLLQVIEPGVSVVTPYDMVPYYDADQLEQWKADAGVYLAELKNDLDSAGISSEVIVEQGPVVRTILEIADRKRADLIAMASHGRSGLMRVFYGSIASGILNQADRPLLLIRAEDAE